MPRKFLIDTDTASDDAIALLMALRWPDVEVQAITVVAGNVNLEKAVRNALYTVELSGKDVPVYAGSPAPLLRQHRHAEWFHGEDGFGNMNYPPAKRTAEPKHAVDAIISTIRANPGIEVVTLGPLTNVALAVKKAPDIVALVSRFVIMGGSANTIGNVTPAAEYNIWEDPEAARIVFHVGLPIEMVGWELYRFDAAIMPHEMVMVRGFDTPLAHFALDCSTTAIIACQKQSNEDGLALADPIAMAVALDPTICTRKSRHYVDIETVSELTRGMTVVDQFNLVDDEQNRDVWADVIARERNVTVCWEIDIPRWKEALYSVLR